MPSPESLVRVTKNRSASDEQTSLSHPIAAAGTLPLGLLAANFGSVAPQAAAQATRAAAAPTLLASPKAADVVDAAEAFLATLSEEQRATAQIELTPQLAIRWTNLPGGSDLRNGVFFRDLKPEQVEAALKVARVALGEEGFSRYQEVRAADDAFAKGRGGRGPAVLTKESRRRSGQEESRRSRQEEGRRRGDELRGDELHDRVPGQAVEDHALDPAVGRPPSRHQHLLQGDDRRRDPLPRRRAADGLEGRSGQDARTARPDARIPARLA